MVVMQSARADASDLFVRAATSTRRIIEGIKHDQWQNATPCAEWDLREVVNHVTAEALWIEKFFTGTTIEAVGDSLDGDLVGDDPLAAYVAAFDSAVAVITDATLDATYQFSFGELNGLGYITQLFGDQLVHGWDIAKGSNQQIELDEELVAAATPVFEEMVAYVGQGSDYGYRQELAAGASRLAALLGVVGRRVDWQPPPGAISR